MNIETNTTAEASGEVTAEDISSIEFEAWVKDDDVPYPPSNNGWVNDGEMHLPVVRLAWASMFKTKAELSQRFIDHPAEMMRLVDGIGFSIAYFRPFITLLEAAEMRLLVSASAACEEASR